MKAVLDWLRDPLIHMILLVLVLALVSGITGYQGEETKQVLPAQPVISLNDDEAGVIEDMSPPIVASAVKLARHH